MIREAEENAEADRILKEKIEAKNQLESYLYNLQSSVRDSLKGKLSEDDSNTLTTKITESLSWLEQHSNEEKQVYDDKRKEVEDVANPIITKAYNAPSTGSAGSPGSASDSTSSSTSSGPTVEEM